MNLFTQLEARREDPVRVAMIGAGKFGSMFLSQAQRLPGIHIVAIADLDVANARSNLELVGWPAERYGARDLDATANGSTFVTDDWRAVVGADVDVVVECTGHPGAAVDHILAAFAAGRHVVNVTVEADALCGPALAAQAARAGVVYSMAYGDQPALVCDLVDWARTCGFAVTAAGRGHKWLPHYRASTPDTIWDHWGLTREQAERGRLNPKMFNAFLDGSKPSIECAAIANSALLDVPSGGLAYPPGSIDDLPQLMRPRAQGGVLERKGLVEVVSSMTAQGAEIARDIRKGVWVVFEAETDYQRRCLEEYKVATDPSGRYASLEKRWHLIGLELPVSIAAVACRGEATGVARQWRGDAVAVAKRALGRGEVLDGEGGYTVAGELRPAAASRAQGLLPLGLAHDATLLHDVPDGQPLRWSDVRMDEDGAAYRLRREMEGALAQAA